MTNKYQIEKSTRRGKKYQARFSNGLIVHFGDTNYQHYKDVTPLKIYSHLDHNDPERRRRFRLRTAAASKKLYSPAWFALNYLW